MKIGDKLKGRITGIQPYGAFVELETGDTGLIHISEIRTCLLYTSPSPRDPKTSRMPSSA